MSKLNLRDKDGLTLRGIDLLDEEAIRTDPKSILFALSTMRWPIRSGEPLTEDETRDYFLHEEKMTSTRVSCTANNRILPGMLQFGGVYDYRQLHEEGQLGQIIDISRRFTSDVQQIEKYRPKLKLPEARQLILMVALNSLLSSIEDEEGRLVTNYKQVMPVLASWYSAGANVLAPPVGAPRRMVPETPIRPIPFYNIKDVPQVKTSDPAQNRGQIAQFRLVEKMNDATGQPYPKLEPVE